MIGLINLFMHILKFPSLPSARSDVALLDVAAGYFGHMEFITCSELNFPFARDVATVARQTVNKALKTDVPASTSADDGFSLANDVDIPFGVSRWPVSPPQLVMGSLLTITPRISFAPARTSTLTIGASSPRCSLTKH